MNWFADHYAADPGDLRTSPLLGDLAGLPPAVVVTASLDPIRDQGRAYAAALALAGVPVVFREAAGNIHGFITLRQAIPSAAGDVAAISRAVKADDRRGRRRTASWRQAAGDTLNANRDRPRPPLPPLRRDHAAQPRRQGLRRPAASITRWRHGRCRRAGSTPARMPRPPRSASWARKPASRPTSVELIAERPANFSTICPTS